MASNAHILPFPAAVKQQISERPRDATCEITIASGLHNGAQFSLQEGDLLVIGSDDGCDICLSDAGIASRHVAIAFHGSNIAVRGLDGVTSVNGEGVIATKSVSTHEAASIVLGADGVRLQISAAPALRAKHDPIPTKVAKGKQRVIALLSFVLFSVIATVPVAGKLNASLSPKPVQADAAIAAAPVKTDELIQQVRDVFRGQGLDAHVTLVGDARIQIHNLDEKHERVRHAAEQVRTDVPQLKALLFASPKDSAPPSDPPSYGNSAGDRIVTRIDGNTAYLVAGAGARYFTGSKLPSGHTVRRITRDAVLLERDGQFDWFRF